MVKHRDHEPLTTIGTLFCKVNKKNTSFYWIILHFVYANKIIGKCNYMNAIYKTLYHFVTHGDVNTLV